MELTAISAASIDMRLAQTQQSVGVAMVKKVMDLQEAQSDALIKSLEQAVPSFGHQLDVRA